MDKLKALIEAAVARFPDDPSTPSVCLSKLDAGWYCSVVRYTEKFGMGKQVVIKAVHEDLDTLIVSMLEAFL